MIEFITRQIAAILDTFDHHYMKLHIRYLYWKSDRQDREIEKLLAECAWYEADAVWLSHLAHIEESQQHR